MTTSDSILERLFAVVSEVFGVDEGRLSAEMSAADVDGWDSVSHAMLVLEAEEAFKVTLGFEETISAANLGVLADIIRRSSSAKATAKATRPIVVFGNCQAESVAACLRNYPTVTGRYDVHFVQSFTSGDDEKTKIAPEILRNCAMLWEQSTPLVEFGQRDFLPDDCKIVSFPSLDFNLLWPLHAVDPRNHPEPGFPFGRYSYGDRIINAVVAQGLRGDEGWNEYVSRSDWALKNLDRLTSIERQRWDMLDRGLMVPMADEIFSRFRTERLFYTYNHPTSDLLCRLAVRILQAAGLTESVDDEATYNEVRALFSWEFGKDYAVPIHPKVARTFDLSWWAPDLLYQWHDQRRGYEESIRKQIDWE